MSGAWVAAGLVLTLLVVALTAVVVRLLAIISSMERALGRHSRELAILRHDLTVPTGAGIPAAVAAPQSVLVTLEPDLESTRSLALDLVAMGGIELDLPLRVLVPDSDEGRALASDLPLPVEMERRDGPVPAGFPSAVVLGADGAVLAKGSPASVADLRALVAAAS
jgi:hypothetical protein